MVGEQLRRLNILVSTKLVTTQILKIWWCRSPANNIGISKFDGHSSPGISRVGELRNSEFSMKGKVTTNES